MQIESMRDFLLFARYMNFSRAAKALGVSQPTLSYRVSQMEKELGFKLLDRSARPRLTAAGKQFVNHAEEIVSRYDEMIATCKEADRNDAGTLTFERPICFESTWREIENLCLNFKSSTNVNVRFVKSEASLFDALGDGRVDVGFVWSLPEFIEEEAGIFGYTPVPDLKHPDVWFYMNKDNPLAKKESLSVQDLDGAKVAFPLDIRFATFDVSANQFMRQVGINLKIVHKPGKYRDVEIGLGKDELAFSMEDLGDRGSLEQRYGLVARRSDDGAWLPEPYFVYRIDNYSPALERLLDYVEQRVDIGFD